MLTFLITFFSWSALIGYTLCFIPQVLENYRRKSTQGWSTLFILMYLAAYLSLLLYIFCLQLPFAYRVMVPIQTFLLITIIMQRFYYDDALHDKNFMVLLSIFLLAFVGALPLAYLYPTFVGNIGGWLSLLFLTIFPIPQIIKMFKEKSMKGFSMGFLFLFTLASLSEFIVSCTGILPLQTVITVLKNLVTIVIFYIQYWLYER